jgi:DNA polymerase-1
MSKTYIVDGNSLLFRSYYSTAYTGNLMVNRDGIPTNAIFAFHNLIKKIKGDLEDKDRLFITFDAGKATFRKEEFQDYKAQRAPAPVELIAQMPIAREMLDAMNIEHLEKEGYEGDDLAGSMARIAALKGDEVTLFTSDKDFLQLLDLGDNVHVCFLKKGLTVTIDYTKKNLKELFGLDPDQITDLKGIAGDPSDNYLGIRGIGEKTAMKLLTQYGHLEGILDAAKKDPSSKTNQKIIAGEKDALFFKKLATILTDMDLEKEYAGSLLVPYERGKLVKFYEKYGFRSFLGKIDSMKKIEKAPEEEDGRISLFSYGVEEKEEKKTGKKREEKKISSLKEIGEPILGLVYDSDGENENTAGLKGFVLASRSSLYSLSLEDAKKDKDFLAYLVSGTAKSTYDLKGLDVLLSRNGLPFLMGVDFDLLIATYLLNPDCGQKKEELFLSYNLELDGTRSIPSQVLSYTLDLKEEVLSGLKDNKETDLFLKTELPLSVVLAKMEIEGFPIDKDVLQEIGIEYEEKLSSLTREIYQLAGGEFNINSPTQLEDVLFHKLGIEKNKGEKGTGVKVLMAHREDHPIIDKIMEYRVYNKLVSSYTQALPKHIFQDEKIHAIYNQALTSTGRLSMSEPNLQNISIRNEEGKNIRKAFFYPNHEYLLLSIDYSQIELRVLASMGHISSMQEFFRKGYDIHKATAAAVFHDGDLDAVTNEERRRAKAVNFGIVYGITSFGLAEQLGISREEAQNDIDAFQKKFPEIAAFQDACIKKAREDGFVSTLLNRRRYLKDIHSKNFALRNFSERAAVNTTIQGSAADLIKVAMVEAQDLLDREGFKTRMLLQIHDELIFKVPKDELGKVLPLLVRTMEHALPLEVPLKAEASYADNWYDAH